MAEAARVALILSAGGARAAYELGVLKAVRELRPAERANPFPILCGTSAGAINAATLAACAEDFGAGVDRLLDLWQGFRADAVYRTGAAGIALTGLRWIVALSLGWLARVSPRCLLDNAPLRDLLARTIDFGRIEQAIASHALHSLSITCSGYASGDSVAFFQGRADLEPWRRSTRVGAHVKLTLDHLMASCAIPFVFPAVRINREYFGDGSIRQLSPISPAIHLGADKVLVIGTGHVAEEGPRRLGSRYPTLAQIAGHVLADIYLDSLPADVERTERVNQMLAHVPVAERAATGTGPALRPVEVLAIFPSESLDELAARHVRALPWAMRALLHGIGALGRNGAALTSYLLFEPPYIQALIDLGYRDAMARRTDLARFLA